VKETAKFCGFCQKVVRYFESFSRERPEDVDDLAWQEEQEYLQYYISNLPSVEIGEDGQPVAQLYRMDIHLFTPALKETSGSKILLMVWEFRDIM
jgi:thiol-disulfide isomerase/thioredoxin